MSISCAGTHFRRRQCAVRAAAPTTPNDAFISNAVDVVSGTPTIGQLREEAMSRLSAASMPTRADESFRFTNISKLLENRLLAPSAAPVSSTAPDCSLRCSENTEIVIRNGGMDSNASNLDGLPEEMFVGSLSDAPAQAKSALGRLAAQRGGVFTWLNSASATDVQVCYVPAGVECPTPLHVVVFSTTASESGHAVMYSPRLLIVAEEGAKVEVIEEFAGQQMGNGNYFVNSVTEVHIAAKASVSHRLVETEAEGTFHVKSTFVQQAEGSSYELVEARLGGQLSRCVSNTTAVLQGLPELAQALQGSRQDLLFMHCSCSTEQWGRMPEASV
jgi:Fe-S cluster assembly protein SufD